MFGVSLLGPDFSPNWSLGVVTKHSGFQQSLAAFNQAYLRHLESCLDLHMNFQYSRLPTLTPLFRSINEAQLPSATPAMAVTRRHLSNQGAKLVAMGFDGYGTY